MIRSLFISWWRVGELHKKQLAFYALPVVVQGLLPLLTLPLTTLILRPRDYGIFGLVNVYTSGFGLVASFGSGFQLATTRMGTPYSHSLIKAVALLSFALSVAFAAGGYLLWWLTRQYHILPGSIGHEEIFVALLGMMLSTPWLVARPLTVLQLRSRLYAVVSTARIIISSAVILIALFAFHQGRFSLFLGMLALGFVDFAGSFLVLKPSLSAQIDRKLLWSVARKGAAITGGSISNMFFPIIERSMLAGAAGTAVLGLYVHAQSYQRLLTNLTDPLRQSAWPQLLAASRGDVPYARSVGFFSLMYAFLIFSGLVFALVGRMLIDLLTHGRFDGAAPFASIMIAILLLILLARPQYAVISAAGDARAATFSTWISTGTAAGLMVVAVPLWGPLGLLGTLAVRYLILAVCFHFFARLHKATPMMDGPPLAGAIAIVALTVTMHLSDGKVDIVAPVFGAAIIFVVLSILSMTSSVKKFDAKHREPPNVVLGAAGVETGS